MQNSHNENKKYEKYDATIPKTMLRLKVLMENMDLGLSPNDIDFVSAF